MDVPAEDVSTQTTDLQKNGSNNEDNGYYPNKNNPQK